MSLSTAETPIRTQTDVPWDEYVRVRDQESGRHVRMTYHNGELIVMSPEYLHERGAECLSVIIKEIVHAFEIDYVATRTTTLRRRGRAALRGSGKEPDLGYYFGANEARVRGNQTIDLDIDPPPDLVIEVENKADAALALPVFAALGVPEIWRFDVRTGTLRFDRLAAGSYHEVDRSVCLPMLTTEMVREALAAFTLGTTQRRWESWVRDWAGRLASRIEKGGPS